MKFKDLYYANSLTPNWDAIEKIPEFSQLQEAKHSIQWHREGNALEHTKLVAKQMSDFLKTSSGYDSRDELILMTAAICHDLGKATTTYWDKDKQDWCCRNHGVVGSNIVRNIFFEEEINLREEICWVVRWHMALHHILDDETKTDRTLISLSNDILKNGGIKYLWALTLCDSLGSINDENEDMVRSKFNIIKERALKLGCFDVPYKFKSEFERLSYFNSNDFILGKDNLEDEENDFCVYIMIGIPGSGKDTFIKNFNSSLNEPLGVICRDDIRTEIGIEGDKPMGTKQQEDEVTQIFNDRVIKYCKEKRSFFINNTNVLRRYRKAFIEMVLPYKPIINYVYIEAPSIEECRKRREGQMPLNVINKMWKNLEFPNPTEATNIMLFKQYGNE